MKFITIASVATLGLALSIGSASASDQISELGDTNTPRVMTEEEMDAFVGAGIVTHDLVHTNWVMAIAESDGQFYNAGHSTVAPNDGISYGSLTTLTNPSP